MIYEKRKYTRLSRSAWAEIRGYWETGDHDLAELSDRFGVSRRAIQSHLKKFGSVKGSKAVAMAAAVKEQIFSAELNSPDTLLRRAKETREAAYANGVIIDQLVMAQLALAQNEPAQAFKAATAIKMLSLAAATLERTQTIKLRALGIDGADVPLDVIPELIIRDLSKKDIIELRARNEDEEEDDLGIPIAPSSSDVPSVSVGIYDTDCTVAESESEDDAIIVEGEEGDEPVKPQPKPSYLQGGGRLVKEASR